MKPSITPYVSQIETKFEQSVPIEETPHNFFNKEGALFKREKDNLYVFVESTNSGQVFVTLFQSVWIPFKKIESDYVDGSILFTFENPDNLKVFIDAIS